MIAPRLILEVGYGATWQTEPESIQWVDETARVNDRRQVVEIVRGASSARGVVDTGELKLTLNNQDRRFDPLYTDGPLYGLLVPGVPIRVLAQVAGVLLPIYDDEDPIYEDDAPVVAEWETAVPVWSGTVASWPQRYDRGNTWATVPLQCFDRFDKLARAKIPRSVLEREILADGPVGYWPLDETSGRTMVDRSGHQRDGEYIYGTTALAGSVETPAGATVRGLELDGEHRGVVVDSGARPDSPPMTVEALVLPEFADANANNVYRLGNGNTDKGLVVAATDTGVAVRSYFPPGRLLLVTDFEAPTLRHLAVRLTPTVLAAYADGVQIGFTTAAVGVPDIVAEAVTAIGGSGGLLRGSMARQTNQYTGFLGHVAVYDRDIGTARLRAHAQAALAPLEGQRTDERIDWILDEIGWPAGLRRLEPGRTLLGAATFQPGDGALQYLRLLEATEDGRLFIAADGSLVFHDRYWPWLAPEATISQVTFTDQPGGACYADFQLDLDDDLIVNVARFTRRGGVEQVATDPASIAVHGEAEEQRSDLLVATDAQARSLAEWTVATRSVPQPRVPSIRIALHTYAGPDQEAVLALDLGHRVTVERTPQGVGDPISLDFLVEGIRHEVAHRQWWVDLYVSPAPQATAALFTLSESELSGPDILAH